MIYHNIKPGTNHQSHSGCNKNYKLTNEIKHKESISFQWLGAHPINDAGEHECGKNLDK